MRMGLIAFCPLAQGALTDKYLKQNKPDGSRLARSEDICAKRLEKRDDIDKIGKLNDLARRRGQTLARWPRRLLRHPEVVSVSSEPAAPSRSRKTSPL